MVSIILISYNLGAVTKACVESIQRNVKVPCEIVIVDNHSDQGTIEILESLENVKLIKNSENLGFPAGCNRGIRESKGEIIWLLNNDTLVPPNSLERMLELLLGSEEIGMVGPVTNYINGRQQIEADYTDDSCVDSFAEKVAAENKGLTWRMMRLVGFSMLARRSTLAEAGYLDERMGIGTFEDDILSMKLIARGYKLLVARDAFIHHIGNASFKAAGGYGNSGSSNQRIASMSAGLTLPDDAVLNNRILEMLPEDARRVLHVEGGAGAYVLKAEEEGVYAEALIADPNMAKIAKNNYRKLTTYIPGRDFDFDGKDFDTVILERQYSDEVTMSVMRSIRPSLAPGARLILQVPKVIGAGGNVFRTYLDSWN